jgi:hypothetical protein
LRFRNAEQGKRIDTPDDPGFLLPVPAIRDALVSLDQDCRAWLSTERLTLATSIHSTLQQQMLSNKLRNRYYEVYSDDFIPQIEY